MVSRAFANAISNLGRRPGRRDCRLAKLQRISPAMRLSRYGRAQRLCQPTISAPWLGQKIVAGSDRARPAAGDPLARWINFWPQRAEHRAASQPTFESALFCRAGPRRRRWWNSSAGAKTIACSWLIRFDLLIV